MANKVVTVGEIMMRLQPPNCDRLEQMKSLDVAFGGGEANVAVCLSELGIDSAFVSKLPTNSIGNACIGELKRWGVNTDNIARGGERIGVYFCEKGYSERPSRVIYDRAYSAISEIELTDIDWEKALIGTKWLHFSGITPALSNKCLQFLIIGLKRAKSMGVTISCDLNYRAKLWTKDKAKTVMTELMQYVDVLIANEEDAKNVFGLEASETDIEKGQINTAGYRILCKTIEAQFNIHTIAFTLRESHSANINGWSALFYTNNEFYSSKKYVINVLDRVGGGDSFCAGLIATLIKNEKPQFAVEYATACSCLKHTVNGDFNIINDAEVCALIKSGGSGRVER